MVSAPPGVGGDPQITPQTTPSPLSIEPRPPPGVVTHPFGHALETTYRVHFANEIQIEFPLEMALSFAG